MRGCRRGPRTGSGAASGVDPDAGVDAPGQPPEGVLSALLGGLECAVFERVGRDAFVLVAEPPAWLAALFPTVRRRGAPVRLGETSDYLDFFLEDAGHHWARARDPDARAGADAALESDAWMETNRYADELPLIAVAWSFAERDYLVLRRAERGYRRELDAAQSAREALLDRDALRAEVRRQTRAIREREAEISMRLLAAAVKRDQETGAHVRRIGLMAAEIGRTLGWDDERVDDMRIAAPMHDIGKIGIPDSILLKPGKLDEAEFRIMQRHAELGAEMLDGTEIPMLRMACQIALHHHERWDGTGYPHGLSGNDIPENARIVSLCDVYDALTHERVYKPAFPEARALAMMSEQVGLHFDPTLFEVFERTLPAIRCIRDEVRDETGDEEFDFRQMTGKAA